VRNGKREEKEESHLSGEYYVLKGMNRKGEGKNGNENNGRGKNSFRDENYR
jgi:hypothetical protein